MKYTANLYLNGSKIPDAFVDGEDRNLVVREILHYAAVMLDYDIKKAVIEIKEIK